MGEHKRLLKNEPPHIIVGTPGRGLQQHYVKLAENEKNRKLNELLDALEFNQVVVFVKSVARAVQLDKLLQECNFPSVAIHASMKQEERIKMYQNFKDFKHRILV